ncbi:MAG: GWxTD domain-containing protein [Ignavibacteriaceae bacterium]
MLRKAIYRAPKKLEYRFFLAEIVKKISSGLVYDIYKDILEIDSTSSKAYYNLGILEESEFDDYNNSYFINDQDADAAFSSQKFNKENFEKAENYLNNSIKYDSLNRDAYLHLSFLYEDNNEQSKGIKYLSRLAEIYPKDCDVHLYLGLLYFETSHINKSFSEYRLALSFMPDSENEDFTFNSVKELIKPILGDKLNKISNDELKKIINIFWKTTNPLYISDYNEALLEHYSRVAYANLRFSVIDYNIPGNHLLMAGWKTDRGEILLRYGLPQKIIKLRPNLRDMQVDPQTNSWRFGPDIKIDENSEMKIILKTNIWKYQNFNIVFVDRSGNNNFIYNEPMNGGWLVPRFGFDTQTLVSYLINHQYLTYTPKFEGLKIEVPYNIVQFRNDKNNYTDVYVNYVLNASESIELDNNFIYNHKWGLFFFDTAFNSVVEKIGYVDKISANREISLNQDKNILVNTLNITIYPRRGNLAFEIERNSDKGVSSNHFEFTPKKFNISNPDMSDLILTSAISTNTLNSLPLIRHNISLLPNPLNTFSTANPIYVYYELYNLNRDKNGSTDFEQRLNLQRTNQNQGISGMINFILKVIGLGKQKDEVTIITKYQTQENDPQIYFQLDMHNYLPGEYVINLFIKDNLTGKEISKDVSLTIN